jgi:hypothetical protein
LIATVTVALELLGGATLVGLLGFLTGYQLGALERDRNELRDEKERKEREKPVELP